VNVRSGVRTDIGRARGRNEDAYLVRDPLFAVADGMGGHRGGNVASKVALEAIRAFDADGTDGDSTSALVKDIRTANETVLARGEADRDLRGMGTTITALLVQGEQATIAHVGDSRAYRLRDGELEQLTQDHTLVHQLVEEGRITADQAGRHPQRSILTRAVGVEPSVDVDASTIELRPGDRLLLCTDGLTGMLSDDAIREVLASEEDPQRASDRLVEAANAAGGDDNITVVVIDVLDASPAPDTAKPAGAGTTAPPLVSKPPEIRQPRRWRRAAILAAAIVIALFIAGWIGVHAYANGQWYVGTSNGQVAIYHGIPARVLGVHLSHVAATTDLSAAGAEQLEPWAGIHDGITATSFGQAQAIVDQIRADLAAAGATSG
jgi:serine/threonine protein phosphatase PrpC